MCPACLTSLALAVGTAGGAGSVAAVLLRRLHIRRNHWNSPRVPPPKEKSP